jgi:DNA polymerase-4
LETELLRLVVRAATDLRRQGVRARTVTVRIRDTDFRTRQAGSTLADPLESDQAIHRVATELLGKLRQARRIGTRLVGVSLSQLTTTTGGAQLGLFETTPGSPESGAPETPRDRTVARAVDGLREKFGDDIVVPGRILGR